MTKIITVNQPNRPEGEDIEVLHLGVFPNGSTSEVSDEAAYNYEMQTGLKLPDSVSVSHDEKKNTIMEPFEGDAKPLPPENMERVEGDLTAGIDYSGGVNAEMIPDRETKTAARTPAPVAADSGSPDTKVKTNTEKADN